MNIRENEESFKINYFLSYFIFKIHYPLNLSLAKLHIDK